jgi:hypothetical protein
MWPEGFIVTYSVQPKYHRPESGLRFACRIEIDPPCFEDLQYSNELAKEWTKRDDVLHVSVWEIMKKSRETLITRYALINGENKDDCWYLRQGEVISAWSTPVPALPLVEELGLAEPLLVMPLQELPPWQGVRIVWSG